MEDQNEIFERYLNGELSEKKRMQFEKDLNANPSMQKELEEYKAMLKGIELGFNRELKDRLIREEQQLKKSSKTHAPGRKTIRTILAIAAIMVLIMVAVFLLRNQRSTTAQLFATYYKPYPNVESPTVRSGENPQNGYALYESGQYDKALEMLGATLNNNPDDETALFYTGVCLLELNRNTDAIKRFQQIRKMDKNRYSRPALWYEALTYLKLNNKRKAVSLLRELTSANDVYARRAKEILDQIGS